jgi:magnesium chelatase family protein
VQVAPPSREVSAAAQLSAADIRRCSATRPARLLASAVDRLGLSARAYGKVLRVARTLADLEGVTAVGAKHVAEAVQCRVFDRRLEPPSAVSCPPV